jgi:hypothetical protein
MKNNVNVGTFKREKHKKLGEKKLFFVGILYLVTDPKILHVKKQLSTLELALNTWGILLYSFFSAHYVADSFKTRVWLLKNNYQIFIFSYAKF